MDSAHLPDSLRELERELADRPRAEPSPKFRSRVLSAMARELSAGSLRSAASTRRPLRSWGLAIAALAAAAIFGTLMVWGPHIGRPQPKIAEVAPGLIDTASPESDNGLPTWRSLRRAIDQSPEGVEALVSEPAVAEATRPAPLGAFAHIDFEIP
jgi:hypothetical protein